MSTPSGKPSKSKLHEIIQAEIKKSGLTAEPEFFAALDGYTNHFNITGKKADIVKAYVSKAAIAIAKGEYDFGVGTDVLNPWHVQSAVNRFHPKPKRLDDPCIAASREIYLLEHNRPTGKIGLLSPVMIKHLDKLKS